MYFQVCSNSAYSQHSGERCRTNGPLVLNLSEIFNLLSSCVRLKIIPGRRQIWPPGAIFL